MKNIATLVFIKHFTKGILKDIDYVDALSFTGYEPEKQAARHLLGVQANIERGRLNFAITFAEVYPELNAVDARKLFDIARGL